MVQRTLLSNIMEQTLEFVDWIHVVIWRQIRDECFVTNQILPC